MERVGPYGFENIIGVLKGIASGSFRFLDDTIKSLLLWVCYSIQADKMLAARHSLCLIIASDYG